VSGLHLKRLVDVCVAAGVLVLFSPLYATIALLVRVFIGRPVIFHQVRPGYRERPFILHKFRTMRDLNDEWGRLLADELRLTRFGGFLRASSLDELPEFWNVFKGEMSLVGPRPLLREYLVRYDPHQRRRHEVKPGITGWAQVNGRNGITWDEKFERDVWYVDHRSIWLDLKILWLTFVKVVQRDGISQPGYATMPEFKGSDSVDGRYE